MNILPINLFNINGCNCPPKKREINFFNKNAVDTVSFSRKRQDINQKGYFEYKKDSMQVKNPDELSGRAAVIQNETDEKIEYYTDKANYLGNRGAILKQQMSAEYAVKLPALRESCIVPNTVNTENHMVSVNSEKSIFATKTEKRGNETFKNSVQIKGNNIPAAKREKYINGNLVSSEVYKYDENTGRVIKASITETNGNDTIRTSFNFSENKIEATKISGSRGGVIEKAVIEYSDRTGLSSAKFSILDSEKSAQTPRSRKKKASKINTLERNISKIHIAENQFILREDFGENDKNPFVKALKYKRNQK